jgi:deazaflavin-dependent oxidoreductase (nitroreductase family)
VHGLTEKQDSARWLYRLKRWMYRDGHPNLLARFMNHISSLQFSTGILASRRWVTLEVPGRRTGRLISCPLVVADHQGERYLVAMLGQDANWVRNVRAAGGRAVLRHGSRETVRLDEVDVDSRAPILRRYLSYAPGARPHLPVDRRAPLEEFDRIAAQFPVFRITADRPEPRDTGAQAVEPSS